MKKKGLLLVMLITVIALVMSSCCGTKTQQTYTLTIEASPTAGGDVSFDNIIWTDCDSQTLDVGEEVTIQARSNTGYRFTDWTKDGELISTQSTDTYEISSQDVTIVANFEEEITFEDPNLEQAVREADGYTGALTGPIYPSDVNGITVLEASNYSAERKEKEVRFAWKEYPEKILYLEKKIEISEHSSSRNAITSLVGIEYLRNLLVLFFDANDISEIGSLANLTNLVLLSFGSNNVSDLSPLTNLINLEILIFTRNNISDLNPLANLRNLGLLSFWDNSVSDLTPLQNLNKLWYLNFSNNQVTDLSPLVSNTSNWEVPSETQGWTGIDMSYNNLDLTEGSQNMNDINTLIGRGIDVLYDPQNDPITFEDPNLEQAVREADGYTGALTGPIYSSDVNGITVLEASNYSAERQEKEVGFVWEENLEKILFLEKSIKISERSSSSRHSATISNKQLFNAKKHKLTIN